MALTKETIVANEGLSALSDEQIAAITTLSKNDEETVIGERLGKMHGDYEKDILEASGIEKKQGEKSYDYAKRVIGQFKTGAESVGSLTEEKKALATKVADLEKAIKEGDTSGVLTQQLADTKQQLTDLQSQAATSQTEWETKEAEYKGKLEAVKVNAEYAKVSLKFKTTIPESVQGMLVDNARAKIDAQYKTDFIQDAAGKTVMIFRDPSKNNAIVTNPANLAQPFTAEQLLKAELKDAIDEGRSAAGGGAGGGAGDKQTVVDISTAKNQVEADEAIAKQLLADGLTRGSAEFAKKANELRKSHGVEKLPVR